jgi:hypothetical protein
MRSARSLATLGLSGLTVALLAGCGAAAKSAPEQTAPPLKPATQVRRMLPTSIGGTRLVKVQMETVGDQLVRAGTPGWAKFDALTRRSWLASGHSIFQVSKGGISILVSVNDFRSMAQAKQLYRLGTAMPLPDHRIVREHVPSGTAPGSTYVCGATPTYSYCSLMWRQGNAIAVAELVGKGPSALDPGVAAQVAPKLKQVQVQMVTRILAQTHVAPGQ